MVRFVNSARLLSFRETKPVRRALPLDSSHDLLVAEDPGRGVGEVSGLTTQAYGVS